MGVMSPVLFDVGAELTSPLKSKEAGEAELTDIEGDTTVCSSLTSSSGSSSSVSSGARMRRTLTWRTFCSNLGPGLMTCLADTDGPCLITAAQSGALWGYSLLSLQIFLIPILFIAQELTVRLGIIRGMGMTATLRADIGPVCAWLVSIPLLASCVLGLTSEFGIIGQILAFWGVSVWRSNVIVSLTLLGIVATGSYTVAERIGLVMGMCQVALFVTMVAAAPEAHEVLHDSMAFPLAERDFVKLITANIGAVIMPWMLAYQQSAICNKGIGSNKKEQLFAGRLDTGLGCIITQGVMVAMLVTVAAVVDRGQSVETVDDLLRIFTKVLGGEFAARLLLTFAMVGACMVAAIVQTLCAAWTFEQAMGRATATSEPREKSARGCMGIVSTIAERPTFYIAYVIACGGAFAFTVLTDEAVDLSVFTEFCNGILMPPIVFALWYLSAYKLDDDLCLRGAYKWFVFTIFLICSVFCVGSIFFSFGS